MSHERNFRETTMATKTSSKTATRKPAAKAFGAGRKTSAAQKSSGVPPKVKPPKKGLETEVAPETTAPGKERTGRPEKPDVSGKGPPHGESVSLIDRKKPAKKTQDGDVKTKRTVLPPISRIRASLEATAVSAKAAPRAQASPPQAPPPEQAEQPPPEAVSVPAEVEAGPQQKVLLIKQKRGGKHDARERGRKQQQERAEGRRDKKRAKKNEEREKDGERKREEKEGKTRRKRDRTGKKRRARSKKRKKGRRRGKKEKSRLKEKERRKRRNGENKD